MGHPPDSPTDSSADSSTAADARPLPLDPGSGLAHFRALRRDPRLALEAVHQRADREMVAMRIGPWTALVLARPDEIQHVFVGARDRYDKQLRTYRILKLILGEGLLTSDGETWRKNRQIAQPAFRRGFLESFAPSMVDAAESVVDDWRRRERAGAGPIDMHHSMMAATLRVVAECLLGADVEAHTETVSRSLEESIGFYHRRVHSVLPVPLWVPTPGIRRFLRQRRALDAVVEGIIAEHRESGRDDDLLGRLMSARDDTTGEGLGDQQLRDEVTTLLLAGHETTANALTFALYLLAHHPEIQDRLRHEIDTEHGAARLGVESLAGLPFLRQVVDEAMRLYPPAWIVERRAAREDVISGHRVARNTIVMLSPWLVQRHPDLWSDPDRFDPDRFAPERIRGRHRFAHFPFGGGERVCIGGAFALMEARLILGTLVQHFRFEPVEDYRLELDAHVTLRPRNGLPLRIRSRD